MARTIPLFILFSPVIPHHFNNLKKLARITVPKLIIHGTRNEIVPSPMGRRLFEKAAPAKYFFPIDGAGHNDTYIIGGLAASGSFQPLSVIRAPLKSRRAKGSRTRDKNIVKL
jgi:fermentation-respiration switch protein FrsA (DUF1100 family)